jgi:hypothetical protein
MGSSRLGHADRVGQQEVHYHTGKEGAVSADLVGENFVRVRILSDV